jgi:4-amino-4-deoxy-L-arabinose transferase-like glycosyltransferase
MTKSGSENRWELGTLVAILLVAAVLRMVMLSDVPPGLRYDELLNYRMAQRVIAGDRPIYFTESWGEEPFFLYAQAIAISWTKASDWSLRVPAALSGLLGVLTAWLAARRILGHRVAVLTAASLAISFWSIFFSREGLRVITVTPFSCLMIYFLWRGLQRSPKQPWRALAEFTLSGICLGAMFYTYVAARVFPLLPIAFAVYVLVFHRATSKHAWMGLLLVAVAGLLVAAPLLYAIYGPTAAEQRIEQLDDAWEALQQGNPGPVLNLAVRGLGMFVWQGEKDWLYNVYGRPIFDPLTAVGFFLGIVICIWQWRQPRCALMLLWLVIGLAPAVIVPPPASLSHAIAAQPPAYILLAVGLDALWRALSARASAKRRQWIAPLLVTAIIFCHGALSCYAYFVTWANSPEVCKLHQCGVSAVARELDARDPPGPVAVGAPCVNYWHPWNIVSFDLTLQRDDLDVRWFNPGGRCGHSTDLGAGWVWPAGEGPVTYYFPSDPLEPQAFDPVLQEIFMTNAEFLSANDEFAAFRLGSPAALEARIEGAEDTPLAWPPDLAHLLPPTLPLVFADRFALLGAELDAVTVHPGDQARLITYWEVLAADPSPVVAFVHLTSNGQDLWGQHDWLDVWADGLQPGDRFVQVHSVQVKPETPPGPYHLELGLYNPHPETLTRLPIVTGTDSTADRVWIGETVRVE